MSEVTQASAKTLDLKSERDFLAEIREKRKYCWECEVVGKIEK